MTSSTSTWRTGTSWTIGPDALEVSVRALETYPTGKAGLIIDRGWASTASASKLLDRVLDGLRGRRVTRIDVDGPVSLNGVRDLAARWRSDGVEVVVGVGGGTVMDAVCLSALPAPLLHARGFEVGRSGLVVLPSGAAPLPRLVVPTTLGTGADVSGTACCNAPEGKLLVLGDALRPEHAAVDPIATVDLPPPMVREAVVEILARLLVPLVAAPVGDPAVVRVADAHALADLALLRSVTDHGRASGFGESARLTLATVSAHTHAGSGTLGRGLFASPLWFVATELSAELALSKVAATALLLPAWAAAVRAGDARWGDAGRLRAAWSAFERGSVFIPNSQRPRHRVTDPVSGLGRFCRSVVDSRWDREGPGIEAVATAVARRCARRWGAGLPMLGSLDVPALEAVIRLALAGSPEAVSVTTRVGARG